MLPDIRLLFLTLCMVRRSQLVCVDLGFMLNFWPQWPVIAITQGGMSVGKGDEEPVSESISCSEWTLGSVRRLRACTLMCLAIGAWSRMGLVNSNVMEAGSEAELESGWDDVFVLK